LPIEAVVRGYLAGSGWKEYQRQRHRLRRAAAGGAVAGQPLPQPIFTPATKAEGRPRREHQLRAAAALIGAERAAEVRDVAIRLYTEAAAYALTRGIVIADTKFEFGLDEHGTLTLMDEVLTPDSSRFWPLATAWREGENPPSFDKQYLRDWLEQAQVDGRPWNKQPPAPPLPPEVAAATAERYGPWWHRTTSR
jgi:phosphoribosylaminoimidazole-succinocarboxamide synthase